MSEEERLVARVLAGDGSAFATLHDSHIGRVRAVIRSFGLQSADVEDLVQQVFLKAFLALSGFRGESSINTWLYRIAHNTTINHLEKGSFKHEFLTGDIEDYAFAATSTPDQEAESQDEYLRALLAAQTLPGHLREVWALYFFRGMDYGAIAQVMKCPIGTVRSRLSRARSQIRADFDSGRT